ncbi:MAG: hypothetical protein ABR585_13630 [Gemmatimonadaceae bacterium]
MRKYLDDEFLSRINIEQAERTLYTLGNEIGFQFKADIWADKVADDRFTESTQVTVDIPTDQWESAWQLWKHNHWAAKWFQWLFAWWVSEPQKTGLQTFSKTKTATLEFRVCKYHTFPDFNPETYPGQFGRHYRYVQQDKLAFRWDG